MNSNRSTVRTNSEPLEQEVLPFPKNLRRITTMIMLLKTTATNKRQRGQFEGRKCRWKVFLWQLPDDLVSWYLPIQDENLTMNTLQSFGTFR